MIIRGLNSALAFSEELQKQQLAAARARNEPNWFTRLQKHHDPRQWHQKRQNRPRFAIIEKAILSRLLERSDDAIRLYVISAFFANKTTGVATLGERRLGRELFFSPYHTNVLTGEVKVGLTKKQYGTRSKQTQDFRIRLKAALEELASSGLSTFKYEEREKQNQITSTILRPSGEIRVVRNLRFKNAYFKIPDECIGIGSFAMYRNHLGSRKQLSGKALRLYLVALRDHDDLAYGGIGAAKVCLVDGAIECDRNGWPLELSYSLLECQAVFAFLVANRLFKARHVVISRLDGHLIRLDSKELGPDERAAIIFSHEYLREWP